MNCCSHHNLNFQEMWQELHILIWTNSVQWEKINSWNPKGLISCSTGILCLLFINGHIVLTMILRALDPCEVQFQGQLKWEKTFSRSTYPRKWVHGYKNHFIKQLQLNKGARFKCFAATNQIPSKSQEHLILEMSSSPTLPKSLHLL